MSNKWYYGYVKGGGKEVFKSPTRPTVETHGDKYNAVVGAFPTKKEALSRARLSYTTKLYDRAYPQIGQFHERTKQKEKRS